MLSALILLFSFLKLNWLILEVAEIREISYLNNKQWEDKGYDLYNNITYELKYGKDLIREYFIRQIIFEGEYLNNEINGKGKEQ